MAIPGYQDIMRPLLAAYADGQERSIGDVRAMLAEHLELTPEELHERLPSGLARTWVNRAGWATMYLNRTGLLERTQRAVYRITDRGREVLAANPERVDLAVLSQFPELGELRRRSAGTAARATPLPDAEERTPEESVESSYQELRAALASDLRERISAKPPDFFEDLVLHVLQKMGYGSGLEDERERLGRSGDGGIDGVIREDRLGLDLIYVQAKRWEASVGRPTIQAFVGALQGARATKGILFTASAFTADAKSYAESVSPRVILVDGLKLAELMIDTDVGVTVKARYEVKRVDEDYFADET